MAQPGLKNYQIQTGIDVGDIVEIINNNGTPGLDDTIVLESNVKQHEQNIEISLSQITQSSATDNQIIIWNNSAGEWQAVDSSTPTTDTRTNVSDNGTQVVSGTDDINFSNLLDVTDDGDGSVTVDVSGDVLTVNNSIDALNDVDTTSTSPSTDDILKWDGSNWVPENENPLTVESSNFTITANQNSVTVECDTSGGNITVTVPEDTTEDLKVSFTLSLVNIGGNTVQITSETNATIQSKNGATNIDSQWGVATIYKRASNEWVLVGDVA